MRDVLIYADTIRSPELRHEIPLPVPDPLLYLEHDAHRAAVVSALELPRIRAALPELATLTIEELGFDELAAQGLGAGEIELELCARACARVGVESAAVPAAFPLELADRLRADGIELRVDRDLFEGRRRVKSAKEIEGIRRAQRACEAALDAAREVLRAAEPRDGGLAVEGEPLTSEYLKRAIEQVFAAHDVAADEFIVAHGAQSAVGHDMGSGAIAPGEPVVIDLWPRDRETGCYSDMTRTYVVGEPSEEIRAFHRLSLEALERAHAAVRPGANGRALMRVVCDLFHEHGYPTPLHKQPGEVLENGFVHGLGHGVGLEVHERPALGRVGDDLVPGDVLTLEPGLYRSGVGGVRLEDIVLVTEDGAESLTRYPYELTP